MSAKLNEAEPQNKSWKKNYYPKQVRGSIGMNSKTKFFPNKEIMRLSFMGLIHVPKEQHCRDEYI